MVILLAFPTVAAHVPNFPEDNDSIERALHIDEPAKSIVVYGQVHHGTGQYFEMEMVQGERIKLGLIIPVNSDEEYLPGLILMGPGIEQGGELPEFIEKPEGYGHIVLREPLPEEGEYEGFSPSAFYELGDMDIVAPTSGDFYVAVFTLEGEGNYGLVVGYEESFTVLEFIRVPLDLIIVYQWEGQTLLEILLPFAVTVAIAIVILLLVISRWGMEVPVYGLLGAMGGAFFLGSSAVLIYQMAFVLDQVPANSQLAITLLFILLPLLLGITAIRMGVKAPRRPRPANRGYLVLVGALGLFFWAGYFIGPMMVMAAGLLPRSIASKIVRI